MANVEQHDADRSSHGPTTLPAFVRQFPTDEACADFLFRLRYPDGYVCPKCGSTTAWGVGPLKTMMCNNGHRASLRKALERLHLSDRILRRRARGSYGGEIWLEWDPAVDLVR